MTIFKSKCLKTAVNSRLMTSISSNLLFFIFVFILGANISVTKARAQEEIVIEALQESAVKVFLDITPRYDEYVKTEIPFVNYVRDRKQAQVYIMLTTQQTGSGGTEHTITFTGQLNCAALNDTLVFVSKQNDSEESIRIGIVQYLKMGLIRYVNTTPLREFLSINFKLGTDQSNKSKVVDKWDYWVFNINTTNRLNGEKSRKTFSSSGSLSADRVTPDWKASFNISANYNRRDNTTSTCTSSYYTRSQNFRGLVVKSLSEHWSNGIFVNAESSSINNIESSYDISPAVEYNVFPYSESTRREFRLLYRVGFVDSRYNEETVYYKMRDTLFRENLSATYEIKERWGSISSSIEGSNYLHDLSLNRLELNNNINLRLFEGLSLDFMGNVSMIHDDLSIPNEGATDEEILLNVKKLASKYEFSVSLGLRYTFGSIYSNVVNPRFGSQIRGGGGVPGGGPGGSR